MPLRNAFAESHGAIPRYASAAMEMNDGLATEVSRNDNSSFKRKNELEQSGNCP